MCTQLQQISSVECKYCTVFCFLPQVAGYLQELVKGSGLTLHLGLVQTAYANGSSTSFITDTMVTADHTLTDTSANTDTLSLILYPVS